MSTLRASTALATLALALSATGSALAAGPEGQPGVQVNDTSLGLGVDLPLGPATTNADAVPGTTIGGPPHSLDAPAPETAQPPHDVVDGPLAGPATTNPDAPHASTIGRLPHGLGAPAPETAQPPHKVVDGPLAITAETSGNVSWNINLPDDTARTDGWSGTGWSTRNSTGAVTGHLTAPQGVDAQGRPLMLHSRFDGTTLVASLPRYAAYPVTVATAYEPATGDEALGVVASAWTFRWFTPKASNRPDVVAVPDTYVYDPYSELGRDYTALHDYCTSSPDAFFMWPYWADFRGPCARHDMCYEARTYDDDRPRERAERGRDCQDPFHSDLRQNCNHYLHRGTQLIPRLNCRGVARIYYETVKAVLQNT